MKYLDEVRGSKTTHPEEATLSLRSPHPSYEMEHIRFSSHSFQLENLIIVRNVSIHNYSKIVVRQMCLQPSSQLRHVTVVVF